MAATLLLFNRRPESTSRIPIWPSASTLLPFITRKEYDIRDYARSVSRYRQHLHAQRQAEQAARKSQQV